MKFTIIASLLIGCLEPTTKPVQVNNFVSAITYSGIEYRSEVPSLKVSYDFSKIQCDKEEYLKSKNQKSLPKPDVKFLTSSCTTTPFQTSTVDLKKILSYHLDHKCNRNYRRPIPEPATIAILSLGLLFILSKNKSGVNRWKE
jgi:hypothetical protein